MPLEEQVAAFVKEYLPENPKEWCQKYIGKEKIIHDALWGTFKLRPHEVALLDTHLLQRLRFLHQTGAVYLTYPSAHHTRFEHTLGVFCQTVRLWTALCESVGKTEKGFLGDESEADVRFAALLHDTGHGPFSHTSEQFFANMPDMVKFKGENSNFEKSGEGEILSALIVQSTPFRNFIRCVNSAFGARLDYTTISGIITGSLGSDMLYLTEIVHGPFDADKLDYMHRDGLFSGLKMHVDVDRLHHSIFIKRYQRGDDEEQIRLCGKQSGRNRSHPAKQ